MIDLLVAGLIHMSTKQHYCVDDYPHVCLPGNSEHKPAACYDDGGVMVDTWPCAPWAPEDQPDTKESETSHVTNK